jgi:hypothetical protein
VRALHLIDPTGKAKDTIDVLNMSERHAKKNAGLNKFVTGFRPIVHARQGLMLGIRQPLDGPVRHDRSL